MKNTIAIFAILIALSACTERIEIELDSTYERLVVEGHITTDTTIHWVRLTRSKDYYSSNRVTSISNAEVILVGGNQSMQLTENPENPGYYETPVDFYGLPGFIYYVDIKLPEEIGESDTYASSCELKPVGEIDSIQVVYNEHWEGYEVRIFAWEPPSTDWYIFQVIKNGVLLSDTIDEFWTSDDRFFNGNYTNGIMVGFLDANNPEEKPETGDTITLKMSGITQDYFNFIIQLQDQTSEYRNPLFSGPPANVITNIPEATGFFAAYSTIDSSTVYHKYLLNIRDSFMICGKEVRRIVFLIKYN